MIRRFFAVLGAAFLGLVLLPLTAFAETSQPYPAPPVTSSVQLQATTHAQVVLPVDSRPVSGALAWTGASFNIVLAVGISVLILIIGMSLVVMGGRRTWRGRSRHS